MSWIDRIYRNQTANLSKVVVKSFELKYNKNREHLLDCVTDLVWLKISLTNSLVEEYYQYGFCLYLKRKGFPTDKYSKELTIACFPATDIQLKLFVQNK